MNINEQELLEILKFADGYIPMEPYEHTYDEGVDAHNKLRRIINELTNNQSTIIPDEFSAQTCRRHIQNQVEYEFKQEFEKVKKLIWDYTCDFNYNCKYYSNLSKPCSTDIMDAIVQQLIHLGFDAELDTDPADDDYINISWKK